MKLPAGTDGGIITNPQDDQLFSALTSFCGAVEIRTPSGSGFILVDDGKLQAAMFRTATDSCKGSSALTCLTSDSGEGGIQTFHLRKYNDVEFERALEICREAGMLITAETADAPPADTVPGQAEPVQVTPKSTATPREFLDQSKLQKIMSQPGVIAVSAFYEGFPVQSMGDADFEHVAASAEDFMRAGVKIAEEMKAGPLDQMILETAENKFIIAPCGDLFLCVFTTADTQLGLIRVVLKSIQSESCR
jgi:predicted regulator of Ras-like GTPase activity (Roadblock/LC7/MglB family)